MTSTFNLQLLHTLKGELDRSLGAITRDSQTFFSTPTTSGAALESARTELRRVQSVLQMLNLRGLVVFCNELKALFDELIATPQLATVMHQDAVNRALLGLTHYLDALANGAPNVVLRLFPEYQEIVQLRGQEIAFEVDLFFPPLDVALPHEILRTKPPADALIHIRRARMHFQQGLLKWLRKEDSDEALHTMRLALDVVLRCVPPASRGFWWVVQGLLDCIELDGLPPDLDARKSFSRVDRRIRSLLEQTPFDEEAAMCEILYLIARSRPVSPLVEQIKQVFDLATYLPETSSSPANETATLLEDLREQLGAAKETWERCVLNDQAACAEYLRQTEAMLKVAKQLDCNPLQYLVEQINAAAINVEQPEHAQPIAEEMALALQLLDSGIEHYPHLDDNFHEQARIVATRLQEGLLQHPLDSSQLTSLASLHCKMEQHELTTPLATEMQKALQQVEQALNAFFSDSSERSALSQVDRLLSQVQSGLHILSLDTAEKFLADLREVIQRFQQGVSPTSSEMQAVATAVLAVTDYVQGLVAGQTPDSGILVNALNILQSASAQPATEDKQPEKTSQVFVVPVRSGDEDEELLEVFLEEAQQVMEVLHSSIQLVHQDLNHRESWVTMRRAFHTLKGSGRMVGLKDLGEVAWAVERAMNKWLASEQPATLDLLELVSDASVLFQHWLDMLKSGASKAQIDATFLLTLADCIEHGKPLPQAAKPASKEREEATPSPESSASSLPQTAAEPPKTEDTVVIGDVKLPRSLFDVASQEAIAHVRTLRACFDALQGATPPVISSDFMRAAHTLAGVNRTMGFQPIAELAHALEMWLEPRINKPYVIGTPQLILLDDVITQLDELCRGVQAGQAPKAQPELIERLQADKPAPASEIPQEPNASFIPSQLDEVPTSLTVAPTPSATTAEPSHKASSVTEAATQQVSRRVFHDDIDAQLLPIFLEEANDLYPQIADTLRAWRKHPDNIALGHSLQRSLHTLKGSARMTGAMRLGELAHRVEDRIISALAQHVLDDALWDEMDNYLDRIAYAIEQLSAPSAGENEQAFEDTARPVAPEAPQPLLQIGAERAIQSAMLRVRSEVVDRLVNEAGEVSVARARAETELDKLRNSVQELTNSVNRLRAELREIEIQAESQMQAHTMVSAEHEQKFDPLEFDRFTRFQELTRFMNESVHDVQTIQQNLLKSLDETVAALTAQAQINRDLQEGLMKLRMVPFSSISERLYRIVRQTSKELGKRANLELSGTEIEIDRSVLEKMTAPFEHLIRNAIAHGLESPEQRSAVGKPPIGEIRLSLRQEGNEVVFELADDGAGLDLERIRQKALAAGLFSEEDEVSDEQLTQLIFTTGLSTAEKVTEVAGRGVGLDVVRSEVSALGGRIDVASTPGQGVRFTIHLPLTLAVSRAVLVRAAHTVYALPTAIVEHVLRLKPAELTAAYQQQSIDWQDRRYPLFYLPRVLGDEQAEIVSHPYNSVLLLGSGEQRIALHVDDVIGNQEVVVKNVGPQLARLPGIVGATVSGDGTVILIINPVVFAQRIRTTGKIAHVKKAETVQTRPVVMVVDDSLTVRKITTRLLERSGYQVVTAKDGVEALEKLMDITPDVMLLDIEMPRMDGFEVVKRLRQDNKTKTLPVIMITSRTADKHRNYALELGVNEYLGKPYQEDALLAHIARFVNKRTA